jgi:NAD-dependent dihydropyrimidine dehydrogenase PreA subunit
MSAPVVIDLGLCDGCDICTHSCPVDVLRLDPQSQKAVVAYPQHCHVCYLCEDDCPTHAITVTTEYANPYRRSIYDVLGIPTERP